MGAHHHLEWLPTITWNTQLSVRARLGQIEQPEVWKFC